MRRDVLENKIAVNAKEIDIGKSRQEYLMRKVFDENEELRELEQKLRLAQVNKERKAQLEAKQQLASSLMVQDFTADQQLLEKLEKERQEEEIREHQRRIQTLENERDLRNQILSKEAEIERQLLEQKEKDKTQVDEIVGKIMNEEVQAKSKEILSKKAQFDNMVESLWRKKQLLKTQQDMDTRAYREAVDFQKILDQRAIERSQKAAAATEFKEKVYAQIESYIKQKKALDEARDLHFKELGDAKYYFEQLRLAQEEHQKHEDVKVDLNNAYVAFQRRKDMQAVNEKEDKEKMNLYYKEINDRSKAIDEEIKHREEIKRTEFKQRVMDLKHVKMLDNKEEQKRNNEARQRQIDEDIFMSNILEQKKQLILEAIRSLGLDNQDLPKGTGLNAIKY